MERKYLIDQIQTAIAKRNIFAALLFVSVISNIFLSIGLISKNTAVVILPTQLESKVSLSKGRIDTGSKRYLIGLAKDFIGLTMDLNSFVDDPHDLNWRKRKILELSNDSFGIVYADSFEKQYKSSSRYFRNFIQSESWKFDPESLSISCNITQKIFSNIPFGKEKEVVQEQQRFFVTIFFEVKNYQAFVRGIKLEPIKGEKT